MIQKQIVLPICSLLLMGQADAFVHNHAPLAVPRTFGIRHFSTEVSDETPSDVSDDVSVPELSSQLLEVAQGLKSKYGVFVIDSKGKEELQAAAKSLEDSIETPSLVSSGDLLGNWTLVCTTATTETKPLGNGLDLSKIPFINEGPLKEIRDSLNEFVTVKQVILAGDESEDISRVDHVLEYKPPKSLEDLLSSLPEQLKAFNINPLDVSKGKVSLIHKASVESKSPIITKLVLESVVLNVAGQSQYLEPDGADVLGINLPLGEFLQNGSFETTYLSDNLRISRSKVGPVGQLRVFTKDVTEELITIEEDIEETVEEAVVEAVEVEVSDAVEETVEEAVVEAVEVEVSDAVVEEAESSEVSDDTTSKESEEPKKADETKEES